MKNKSLLIRTAFIVVIVLVGIYLVFGPRRVPTGADFTWTGIKTNLSENINLGLDLRGGSHLVMRVKGEDYLKTVTEGNAQAAATAATDLKLPVTGSSVVTENGTYSITLNVSDPSQNQAIIDEVKKKVDLANWTESQSGNTIVWTLPNQTQDLLKRQAVDQALKIIDSRINAFGVKEPTLQKYGSETSGQILLQMPGVDNPERIKELIRSESNLSLAKLVSPASPSPAQTYPTREAALQSLGGTLPPNRKIWPYSDRDEPTAAATKPGETKAPTQFVVVEYPSVVDGSELRDANAVSRTGSEGDYQISFSFKPGGAQKFGDWTGKNINNYMAVHRNRVITHIYYGNCNDTLYISI